MPPVHHTTRGCRYQEGINMLPMIDILLVLLIIFMIRPKELRQDLHLPSTAGPEAAPVPTTVQIVLEVTGSGYLVNAQLVPDAALEGFLRAAFAHRDVKLLFVRARPDVPYREVIRAVDRARGAGVQLIAHMPSR